MKKSIIIVSSLIIAILICLVIFLLNEDIKSEELLTKEEKQMLINNLTVEKENILTSGTKVTIIAELKNNNKKSVKVKEIKVILLNEYEENIKEVNIEIGKIIKKGKSIKFNKIIEINKSEPRVFTKYKIIL